MKGFMKPLRSQTGCYFFGSVAATISCQLRKAAGNGRATASPAKMNSPSVHSAKKSAARCAAI